MNSVILIGRLTRDPEVRYTSEQMAVATFNLAIDRPPRPGKEKQADFPRITVFGKQAETCERFLAKGRMVAVNGRIQTGSYQNKDGATVYTTDVVANNVEFLDWGDKAKGEGGRYDSRPGAGAYARQGNAEQPETTDLYSSRQPESREKPVTAQPEREPGLPEGFTTLDDDDDDVPF